MAKVLQASASDDWGYFTDAEIDGYCFPILGTGIFNPHPPSWIDGTYTDAESLKEIGHKPSFAGALTKMSVTIAPASNDRITVGRVVICVNDVETDLEVEIPASSVGTFYSTDGLTATFAAGDRVYGKVFLPQQDINDPLYVGDTCWIVGVAAQLEATEGHWGVHRVQTDDPSPTSQAYLGTLKTTSYYDGGNQEISWTDTILLGGALNHYNGTEAAGTLNYDPNPGPCVPPYSAPTGWPLELAWSTAQLRDIGGYKARVPGAFKNLIAFVEVAEIDPQNDASAPHSTAIYLNVNGTNSSSSLTLTDTLGSASSGEQQELAFNETVASGDVISYSMPTIGPFTDYSFNEPCTFTATANYVDIFKIAADFEASLTRMDVFMGVRFTNGYDDTYNVNSIVAADVTGSKVVPIVGGFDEADGYATEFWEYVSITPTFQMGMEKLRIYCSQYAGDPITFTVLVDGVASDLSITVNGDGWFEDTTNVVETDGTQAICLQWSVADGQTFNGLLNGLAWTQYDVESPGEESCQQECPNSITLQDMRDRVYRMLGEDPDAPVYWSNDEIDHYISDAYIKAARESKAIEYIEGIELAADNEAGTLSDYVGQILRVTYDDRKIENTTKFELDRFEADWENQSGYVDSYVTTLNDNRRISTFKAWDGGADNSYGPFYSDGAHTYAAWATATAYVDGDRVTVTDADSITRGYVCISGHTSGASTEPGTGASWETVWVPIVLMVWAVKNPATLTAACDEPELPPWTHLGLCFAAAAAALLKHGEMRDEGMAAFYASVAQEYLSLLKGYTNNRTPERVLAVGGQTVGIRIPKPWDRVIQ